MTSKLIKASQFVLDSHGSSSQNPLTTRAHAVRHGFSMQAAAATLVLVLLVTGFSSVSEGKSKTGKFHGTLVVAGPKAITVKSRDNIYLVRTFNYSPELEKKIPHKKLSPGKKVTVHYILGTDQATRVD